MGKIRCAIADVPQTILADILQRHLERSLDVEFIQRIDKKENIKHHLCGEDVDVVITSFDLEEIPQVCNNLLDEFSDVVVGLVADGRRTCIYIDDIAPKKLTELIRVLVAEKQK